MASSVVASPAIVMSYSNYRIRQIRAQSYRDEGKSRNVVDANIQVLKERMEQVKMKERLERCLVCDQQGWNYRATTNTATLYNQKKWKKELDYISQCVQLFCMVGGTIGFTILASTLCLYLISLLIHLNLSN